MTNLLIRVFIKDHERRTNTKVRENYGKFASMVGILSNLFLFAMKVTVGMLFNSIAIVADAINNLSDSGSSIVALLGFKISGKPADAEHPFGHARMEYIAGLIVSFVILILGYQLILDSVDKMIHPRMAEFSPAILVVLVASIVIKVWQARFYRTIGKLIHSTTLEATSIDSRNDVLATTVVLLGVLITRATGFDLDGYLGVVVAIIILLSGVNLIRETISPLLGAAPNKELVDNISRKILSFEGILGIHDLTVHNYGVGKTFASVHCEMSAEEDILVSHDVIDNIERDFMTNLGIHLVIHLDPIATSDKKTSELRQQVKELIGSLSPQLSMHDFRVVWGISHINVIFDLVIPFDFHKEEEKILQDIRTNIYKINSSYHSVITVDRQHYQHLTDSSV